MKGADQCPRCASRKWKNLDLPTGHNGFYADTLRVCVNCTTAWEPFEVTDLLDEHIRTSSFKEPCNNCAFRKGSPEQSDPQKFSDLRNKLGWPGEGAAFFCHKGLPIAPDHPDGFEYPSDGKDPAKLRYCRGYLNTLPDPLSARAEQ